MDGSGGRGSYSRLSEALTAITTQLRDQRQDVLGYVETMNGNNSDPSVDLIVEGIWMPVCSLLQERYANMFSVGIAQTYARCFSAVETFVQQLSAIAGTNRVAFVSRRLRSHASYTELSGRWRHSLYLQLRLQESKSRVDRLCELAFSVGPCHSSLLCFYSDFDASQKAADSAVAKTTLSLHELADFDALAVQLRTADFLTSGLLRAFAIEMALPLHPQVCLEPLRVKFFGFSLQVLSRLRLHLTAHLDLSADRLPEDGGAANQSASDLTPLKRAAGIMPSPSLGNLASPLPASQFNVTLDDIVVICLDLSRLPAWLVGPYSELCLSSLGGEGSRGAVDRCAAVAIELTTTLREAVWTKVCALLCAVSVILVL